MKRGAWFGAWVVCVTAGQTVVGCFQPDPEPSARESSSSSESGKDDDSSKDDEEDDEDAEGTSSTSDSGQTTGSSTSSGTSTSTTTSDSGTTSTSSSTTTSTDTSGPEDSGETGESTGDEIDELYFSDWPEGASPHEVGRLLANRFIGETPPQTESEQRHYKEGVAWYGALKVATLLDDQDMMEQLRRRYDQHLNWPVTTGYLNGPGHVDDNVYGIVPLELWFTYPEAQYVDDGVSLADHQIANGSHSDQIRGAVDDMFMMVSLQVQAYRVTGDTKYLDFAASNMVGPQYLGRQFDDGLFNQLPNGQGEDGQSQKWSRGNGWFAAGMAEILLDLEPNHQHYATIKAGYDKMMAGLLTHQIQSGVGQGIWKQVINSDDPRNFPETSGSAMFTFAMITGVKNGWLDAETYGPAARTAWLALVLGYMDPDGRVRDVSNWMYGGTLDRYVTREVVHGDNHGQAPMLWSAAALMR